MNNLRKLIIALFFFGFASSAWALDFERLTLRRDSIQIFVQIGGAIVPATEQVADELLLQVYEKGRFDCEAKFFHTSHQGVHTYMVYAIRDCVKRS